LTFSGTKVSAKAETWQAEYTFYEDTLEITLTSHGGTYHLPIVCKKDDNVMVSDDCSEIKIDKKLTITSDTCMHVDCDKRSFNQVGGFSYLPISIEVQGRARIDVHIES